MGSEFKKQFLVILIKHVDALLWYEVESLGPDQGQSWNMNKKQGPLYSEPSEPWE